MSFTATSIMTATNNAMGTTVPLDLNRPVEKLSEHIQKAARAFYDVHALLTRKKSSKVLEVFLRNKGAIRSELGIIHKVLQSSYRHIIDFTSSCKRAPDERAMSAQRCHRSGRAILRDIQDVIRSFDSVVDVLVQQRSTLSAIWLTDKKCSEKKGVSAQEVPHVYPVPDNSVSLLYDALDDISSALQNLFVFWDGHVSFLTLILNRQTNAPNPGEETRETVLLWTEYQKTILKANSSISQYIEMMSIQPVISSITINRPRQLPWRRHTYPQTELRREPKIIEDCPKPTSQWHEYTTRLPEDAPLSARLTEFIRGLF